ncbi:hypothetical protein C8J57DRAFT_1518806 [Mycena rebaudengoi]|nr:hypothetical protein C8J57DRAFT_1518806 [Mycena rebaudengoi]
MDHRWRVLVAHDSAPSSQVSRQPETLSEDVLVRPSHPRRTRKKQAPLFSTAPSRFPRLLTPHTLVRAAPPLSITSALSPPRRDFRGSFTCDTPNFGHLPTR